MGIVKVIASVSASLKDLASSYIINMPDKQKIDLQIVGLLRQRKAASTKRNSSVK